MENNFLSAFERIIASQKKIVIIPHRNPDGDALGGALALKHFLDAKKHEVKIVSPNDYPSFLHWMKGNDSVIQFTQEPEAAERITFEADVIFCLDTAFKIMMMQLMFQWLKAQKTMSFLTIVNWDYN